MSAVEAIADMVTPVVLLSVGGVTAGVLLREYSQTAAHITRLCRERLALWRARRARYSVTASCDRSTASAIRADADPGTGAWLLLSVLASRPFRAAAMPDGDRRESSVAALAPQALMPSAGPAPSSAVHGDRRRSRRP
jgi:hypothetical protein